MPVCSQTEITFFSESLDASSVTSFKLYGLKRYLILIWFWIATMDSDLAATLSKPLMSRGVWFLSLLFLFYFYYYDSINIFHYWIKFLVLFFHKKILIWKLDHRCCYPSILQAIFVFPRYPSSPGGRSLIETEVIHSAIGSIDFLISLKSQYFSGKLEVKRRQN